MMPELVGKQLELLKEVLPADSRVALLGNPTNPANAPLIQHAAGVLAAPLAAAQQARKVWQIGMLSMAAPPPASIPHLSNAVFVQTLSDLGYVEGRTSQSSFGTQRDGPSECPNWPRSSSGRRSTSS